MPPEAKTITQRMLEPDIVALVLDTPGKSANILSSSVLDELAEHLDQLEARDDVAGLVIVSGKPGMFIAGADLREFAASLDIPKEKVVELCRRGQTLFGRLSKCPFVTIAAIDGICVGGGAELAIWCDRRILTSNSKTQYGFPEVKLGLFPGWGGTARASRIVGLGNAVEMITGGESIDGAAAAAMGLADDVVPTEQLEQAAVAMVRAEQARQDYVRDRARWSQPVDIDDTELGFLGATAAAMIRDKTKGQYPAPDAALNVMLEAAGTDVESACVMEAEGMAELFGSPVNAALLNLFFLTDRVKKDHGIVDAKIEPGEVTNVGVLGAGIMGAGIASANIKRNLPVTLSDANRAALTEGARNVLEEVSYNKHLKGPDVGRSLDKAPLLNLATVDQEFAECDLVIEAIVENPDVKRQVYQRIEPLLGENTVLASNTSTIPISTLAEGLERPENFCGIHFFNPVRRMQLVEVIRGRATSDKTVATAVAYAKRIGKMPVVVNDGPGFLVNRLLFPYMNEAIELISEGVPIADIERAAKSFGMPMGPIALYDVVGLDTAVFAGRTIWEAFPDRVVVSPIAPALVKAGRLGQKSGVGFYRYSDKKKKGVEDPELADVLKPYVKGEKSLSREEIQHRLILPMLLEATRLLDDHLVRDVRDVDLGLILGIGFPPFRGGLLFWADSVGVDKILEMLAPLAELGPRYEPTPMLKQMAETGSRFYPR